MPGPARGSLVLVAAKTIKMQIISSEWTTLTSRLEQRPHRSAALRFSELEAGSLAVKDSEETKCRIAGSGLMGALDPGTASIAPIARFGMCGKANRLVHSSGL